MNDLAPMLAHVVPFLLVAFRIAGLFIATPLLASPVVPMRARALLAMALSASAYPMLHARGVLADAPGLPSDAFSILPLIVRESLIGFCIGLIAGLPLLALEMSGTLMGHQMGFGLARVYNPEADADADVLGQLLSYAGVGVFVGTGGLEGLFQSTVATFDRLPIGGMDAGEAPLALFVGVLSSSFELALRVAAPVAGIVLLLIVLFGAIGKTMPQINVMSVGFMIKIVGGMAMVVAASYAIQGVAGDLIHDTLGSVHRWASSLGR